MFEILQMMSYYFYFQNIKYSLKYQYLANYTYTYYTFWNDILITSLYDKYKKEFLFYHDDAVSCIKITINNQKEIEHHYTLDGLRKGINSEGLTDYQQFLFMMIDMMYSMNFVRFEQKYSSTSLINDLSSYLSFLNEMSKKYSSFSSQLLSKMSGNDTLSLKKIQKKGFETFSSYNNRFIEKSTEMEQILENTKINYEYKDDINFMIKELTKKIDTCTFGLYKSLISEICYELLFLQSSMMGVKTIDDIKKYEEAIIRQDTYRCNELKSNDEYFVEMRDSIIKALDTSINTTREMNKFTILLDSLIK